MGSTRHEKTTPRSQQSWQFFKSFVSFFLFVFCLFFACFLFVFCFVVLFCFFFFFFVFFLSFPVKEVKTSKLRNRNLCFVGAFLICKFSFSQENQKRLLPQSSKRLSGASMFPKTGNSPVSSKPSPLRKSFSAFSIKSLGKLKGTVV